MGAFNGKVVWITGAGSGIGKSLALEFASQGATIVVSGRRKTRLDEVAAEITKRGAKTMVAPCDVTDESQIEHLFTQAQQSYGRVDIAVNCSGGLGGSLIADVTAEDMRPTPEVSFIGTILLFKP